MFNAAGTVMCKIDEIKLAEPKFADPSTGAFDICVHGTAVNDPNQGDWWIGEFSSNYGTGNFATMTQAEITMKTLHNIGFEGNDLSTLKTQLIGKEVPYVVKETPSKDGSGKVFYNVKYIGEGGGYQPKEIDMATVQGRINQIFANGAPAAPAPQPKPAAAPNPFTKPAAAAPQAAAPNPFTKPAAAAPQAAAPAPAAGGAKVPF